MNNYFNFFNEGEDELQSKLRKFRDYLFGGLIAWLHKLGITPNMLTGTGLLTMLTYPYFFSFNPVFSFLIVLFNVFLDALDGPLARLYGKKSVSGAINDFAADHLAMLIVCLTYVYFGFASGFWMCIYLVSYLTMLGMVIFCRVRRITFFPVLRSKYLLYGTLLFWLISGINITDPLLIFFSVYMVITDYFLYGKIKCSLK